VIRLLVVLLLVGCAERVRPVEVKVPVEVARTPPPELLSCTSGITPPLFEPTPGGVRLEQTQVFVLQNMIARLYSCDAGWRAWATHEE